VQEIYPPILKLPPRKTTVTASIVIPNWNGHKLLKICLPSLTAQTFLDFEIIVVDNGSTDESIQYIEENFPQVNLIKLPLNIGFSPAANKGILVSKGTYIILINNDTKVDKDCIRNLVSAANLHPEVGMVAAKMLQFFNPELIDSAGDYIDMVGHADNIGFGEPSEKFKTSNFVFLVTGGGGLFKREMLEKIGLFDETFFAYYEDVDLCLRAQMAGFKGWFESTAKIWHIHKATSRKNLKLTEYLQFRNMTQTIITDFPAKLFKNPYHLLMLFLVNLNTVRFLGTHGYFKEAISSEWYILKNWQKLIQKRRAVQQMKKVSDEYMLQNIRPKKITWFGLIKV